MKISKQLSTFLKSVRKPGQVYVEPFCGACSILRLMDGPIIANDNCPYLMNFLKRLSQDWVPPKIISEERYKELYQKYKEGYNGPEIGFAAYFCSFAGKFFAGYARDRQSDRDFSKEAYNDAIRLKEQIKNVEFFCSDYAEFMKNIIPEKSLVWCDPPYEGVTGYKNKFDNSRFWEVVRNFSTEQEIYVSEYKAPKDFECVWSCERRTELNTKTGKDPRIEKLFKYKG